MQVLELVRTAASAGVSAKDVKRAYFSKARLVHPDKIVHTSDTRTEHVDNAFKVHLKYSPTFESH
jgi:curved DNA-binding protein CbpA